MSDQGPRIAIVDFGMGNLYSVKRACDLAGLDAAITSSKTDVWSADGVILPGVGAFGKAMETLRELDLVSPLRDIAASGKPLLGICLGQQLLMTESWEFGRHRGLNLINGEVMPFHAKRGPQGILKVPHVGWNRLYKRSSDASIDPWRNTPLCPLKAGEYMYFVHSFYVDPADPAVACAISRYGDIEFCSGLAQRNIFACQFHPERSGLSGIAVYQAWSAQLRQRIAQPS